MKHLQFSPTRNQTCHEYLLILGKKQKVALEPEGSDLGKKADPVLINP